MRPKFGTLPTPNTVFGMKKFFVALGCFLTAFCLYGKDTKCDEEIAGKAWSFLCENMPAQDRGKVSEAYLRENLGLALRVRGETPWGKAAPENVFLNAVVPYSSIGEPAERWRPVFYERFLPLVASCKTATEAVELLNREIWKIVNVRYSTTRERPDQAPFDSMRQGVASCSGLSVILIDACRAVGIPARFAGCKWRKKPGNHSWVEFWADGDWHYIGAFDSPKANESWFDPDLAHAEADDPRYAIYAANWAPTGSFFQAYWRSKSDSRAPIPAYNVTARYLKKTQAPAEKPLLSLDVRDANGLRVAVPVNVVEKATGRILASGKTQDESGDFNRHFTCAAPAGTAVEIRDAKTGSVLGEYTFTGKACLLTLKSGIEK